LDMKISTQSRYGLRALFDIAYHSAGLSTQVKDIASRQAISPRYIEQIFQKLKRAGIIRSVRGPSGGYYLAKKIDEITVGDVVRATEGAVELVHCMENRTRSKKACDRIEKCVVRDVWTEASKRLVAYLDSVTLQDLCKEAQQKGLERLIDKHLMYYI
jgi:Rrf2 family transcriptional regulator, iron-sulfur cluster assembly transcription factor